MIELFHDENNNGILENSLQTIKVPPRIGSKLKKTEWQALVFVLTGFLDIFLL